jgi:anti-sigma B factor antagonist
MTSSSHRRRRRSRRRPIVPARGTRHAHRRPSPPHAPVHIAVEQHATVALLRVTGEFDLCAVEPVERALGRAVDALTDQVVFDLRGVSFLDLAGVATLLRADARARRRSYCVEVVPPPGAAARIFTLTEADRRLTLVDAPPG